MDKAKTWIENSKKIIFFTGAGISTGSGLPTFRGLFGLYNWPFISFLAFSFISVITSYFSFKLSVSCFICGLIVSSIIGFCIFAVLTCNGWKYFTPLSWIIWKLCFFDIILSKPPSKSHELIKNYSNSRDGVIILTTNVDGLEGEYNNVHRLHGYFREFICTKCGKIHKFKGWKRLPWKPLKCCGRYIRTKCSLFGDENIPNKYINWTLFDTCPITKITSNDVFIVIGSSATYSNNYFEMVFNSECKVIEINVNNTSVFEGIYDKDEQIYLKGKSDDVLQKLFF